jgi:hypothetical protein
MRSRAPNPKGSARYTLAVHGDTGRAECSHLEIRIGQARRARNMRIIRDRDGITERTGAEPAVGRAGLKPPYRCHDNGASPWVPSNFYRHERDKGCALEIEDELSPLFYEFLDPPLGEDNMPLISLTLIVFLYSSCIPLTKMNNN